MGGAKGKFGYPVDDETLTPDRLGRMSVFEDGEIWWYPDKGAFVRSPEGKQVKSLNPEGKKKDQSSIGP
jgi:uncharacterized protein with LGFP repeats